MRIRCPVLETNHGMNGSLAKSTSQLSSGLHCHLRRSALPLPLSRRCDPNLTCPPPGGLTVPGHRAYLCLRDPTQPLIHISQRYGYNFKDFPWFLRHKPITKSWLESHRPCRFHYLRFFANAARSCAPVVELQFCRVPQYPICRHCWFFLSICCQSRAGH